VSVFAHQLLLALSLLALGGAGARLASLAAPAGPERALAAIAAAASLAALEALALGRFDLGTSPVALGAAAAATWLLARLTLPAPRVPLGRELARWWAGLGVAGRAAVGALAGAAILWVVWVLRFPYLGIDALAYHLPEVVAWIHEGDTGGVESLTYEFPVGNYPLTNEVLVAWIAGLSRSAAAVMLWTPAALGLLALAGWAGLRRLGAGRGAAALAVGAVCTLPMAIGQVEGPNTDLPALAWLVTAAALVTSATAYGGRPMLLVFSLLAAGLAVGTKTTTLPFAAIVIGGGLIAARRSLRPLAPALGVAAGCALLVGGVWYARNLVSHGSPFWPFLAAPWGDPVPPFLDRIDFSLLDRPVETLEGQLDDYLDVIVGGVVVIACGLLAFLLDARRHVVLASAATALGLLLWANAPFTGVGDDPALAHLAVSSSRYLLPTISAAALALALASGAGHRRAALAILTLAGAAIWNLETIAERGYPYVPSVPAAIAAAAAGALAAMALAAAADRLRRPLPPLPAAARWLLLLVPSALAAAMLTASTNAFLDRYLAAGALFEPLVGWFNGQTEFRDEEAPISFAPIVVGPLAGERLQHRLELIPAREPCAAVRARARDGWVVTRQRAFDVPFRAPRCLARERPIFEANGFRVYGQIPEAATAISLSAAADRDHVEGFGQR
jgi:hypothetical protein